MLQHKKATGDINNSAQAGILRPKGENPSTSPANRNLLYHMAGKGSQPIRFENQKVLCVCVYIFENQKVLCVCVYIHVCSG